MVAGAAGIDFVLLVIAADKASIPGARQHLEICSLLGIQAGLVALTRRTWSRRTGWNSSARKFPPISALRLADAPMTPVYSMLGSGLRTAAGIAELSSTFAPTGVRIFFACPSTASSP